MLSERYDLSTYKQESLNLTATLYVDDAATTPWNLTGYTAALRIMDKPAGNVIATLTDGAGITLGGSAGTITVARTPAQVQAWKIAKGAYDLTVTSTGNQTTLVLHGELEVVAT